MEEEKKQNQYRFLKITTLLILILLSFLLGKYIGTDKDENIIVDKAYKIKDKKEFSGHIAVVDLDDGVELGGEKKYYSKEIIELPNLDFTYTGLGDARTGLENGTYGAYVVIPSTFSRNVVSINENPIKTKINFEINKDLDGETKSKVIYNLMKFEKKINNDLSYVYVNNILKEFHEAQDISEVVMNNDLKDKKAILEIQAYDLIEMVDIPELERVENTAEPLDFSNYIEDNQEIISAINDEYKKQIEISLNGMYDLKEEGENLADKLDKMIAGIGEVNIIRDEDGTIVYEKGVKELNNEVQNYNTGLKKNRDLILNDIKNVSDNQTIIQETISDILLSINKYNKKLEKALKDKKDEINEELIGLIPEVELNMSRNQRRLGISYGGRGPGIDIDIVRDINEEEEEREKTYIEALQQILSEVNNSEEIKENLGNDSEFLKLIEKAGFNDLDGFLSSEISREVAQNNRYRLRVREDEKDGEKFTNYAMNRLEKFDFTLEDIEGIEYDSDEFEEFLQLIGEQTDNLLETNEKIESIEKINDVKLNKIITGGIVRPLEIQAKKVKDDIKDRNDKERSLIRQYNASIDGYEPIYEIVEIDNKLNIMNENTINLYDDINNNNEQYLSLVDKMFENYDNNTNILIDNIYDANEVLDKKIETGLEEAKNVKNSTSKENQDLLEAFSKKLSYTRVGSIEYTEVYDFIANPINLESNKEFTEDKKAEEEEPTYSDLDKSVDKNEKDMISGYKFLLIMGVCLFSLLVIFILLRRDNA